jgi:hypothetical protein
MPFNNLSGGAISSFVEHTAHSLEQLVQGSEEKLKISNEYSYRHMRELLQKLSQDKDYMQQKTLNMQNFVMPSPAQLGGAGNMMPGMGPPPGMMMQMPNMPQFPNMANLPLNMM